jgi:protein-tyrosine phosphatase
METSVTTEHINNYDSQTEDLTEDNHFPFANWESFFKTAGLNDILVKQYTQLFKKHEIEYDMINDLTHDVLLQMGVNKAGHRIKILRMRYRHNFDIEDPLDNGAQEEVDERMYELSHSRRPQAPLQADSPRKHELPNGRPASGSYMMPNSMPDLVTAAKSKADSPSSTPVTGSPAVRKVNAKLAPSAPKAALRASDDQGRRSTITLPINPLTGSANSPSITHSGIKYYVNDEVIKHRLPAETNSVQSFSQAVNQKHGLHEFAVFAVDSENKLKVVKADQALNEEDVYYVIENNRLDAISKRIEKKVKKDTEMAIASKGGRLVYNSDNNPLKVDFIPDSDLYMNQMGRIGMCMAPGRKKKKKAHDWDRDLAKDLDRIRTTYGADVFVSLIRHSELHELQIGSLFDEVEARKMESIHFPIKDKWIPNSMEGLIYLVDAIIQRLKEGKAVVVHCNGGKGRTGTVVVATLVGLGKKVHHAIDVVRKSRPGTIRNPMQIMYVKRFKSAWRAYKKKQARINMGLPVDGYIDDEESSSSSSSIDLTDVDAEFKNTLEAASNNGSNPTFKVDGDGSSDDEEKLRKIQLKAANSMGNTRIDKIKKDKDRKKLTDSYSKKDGKRENSFKEGEEKKSDKEDSISKEAAKSAKKEEKEKLKREAKEAKEERKKDKKRRSDERKEKEGDSGATRTNSRIQIYSKDSAANPKVDSVTSPRAESSNNITANTTVQVSTSTTSVNKESPKGNDAASNGVLVTPVNLSSPSDTNGAV